MVMMLEPVVKRWSADLKGVPANIKYSFRILILKYRHEFNKLILDLYQSRKLTTFHKGRQKQHDRRLNRYGKT